MNSCLLNITCDHCGKSLVEDDIRYMYSIKVDSEGRFIEIVRGMLHESLHFCCDTCMFNRSRGTINYNDGGI